GGVNFLPGSVFAVEVAGLVPGSQYDQLRVLGPVTLNGPTLSVFFGLPISPNSVFIFIDNDGSEPIAGTFAGLVEEAVTRINGGGFQISYPGGAPNQLPLSAAR